MWIFKLKKYKIVRRYIRRKKGTKAEYEKHKAAALVLAKERILHFNTLYQFKVNKISIRNQRTRWGSCSKKGNVNFNYKIVLLPQALADYVIVHELCHLGEFNHSKNFWALVAKALPDYKAIKQQFRKVSLAI